MCFYLLELKQNCTKIYVKEIFSFAKRVFLRRRSWENVFFYNIQTEPLFAKKNYSTNISSGIQGAKNIFSFFLQKDYSKNQSSGIQSGEIIFFLSER